MRTPTLVTITAPTQQAVTLEAVRRQLRAESELDDELVQEQLIPAATSAVEAFLNRQLMPTEVELRMDRFPPGRSFKLVADPVRTLTSIVYDDENDTEQTLATSVYEADLAPFAGLVQLRDGQVWPNTYRKLNAVRVRMDAGYADAESIPADIKHGLLLMVSHLHENPEPVNIGTIASELPHSLSALLWPHRMVPT